MSKKITTQKQQLRYQLREARRSLSNTQQSESAQSCAQLLIQSQLLENSSRFAVYLANDGELDPRPLIEYLWQQGKQTFLPVIDGEKLIFARYQKTTRLIHNRYGIAEPENSTICPIKNLDIIFLPLVAFDETGQRLGMGGGFYDRSLEGKLKVKTIGLAHHLQLNSSIPTESWDRALDIVVTPKKLYQF